ncbi:hypothetical protein E2562_010888 [Oryza meyeriana var. granulata]|uniref:Uncharacterized protein n=1 Tax=Oryza meyeriana var. granulata TaxID=110450 RepID=A0A6G1BUK5_9ORYZ|nr:hypothetical protein E2562_010888 [Oryza meyeriana var. granulata]KAF0891671.1 hypothetical protein E2562_010888 [Oryza meyeriana var. granulata]
MAQLERGSVVVGGRELLASAPPNVALRPAVSPGAAFLGATAPAPAPSSRHVFPLGTLARGWRWLALFRFKIWWMIPTMGEDAAGVPAETQMLLLEARNEAGAAGNALYALMLPVLDGSFRASLQGSPENELQFCFESGRFILDLLDSEVLESKRTVKFGILVGISDRVQWCPVVRGS